MHIQLKFPVYILIGLFFFPLLGCKTIQQKSTSSLMSSQVISSESFFHSDGDVQSSKDLEAFLEKYKSIKCEEQAKIDYLLDVVKKSHLTFVRNGESYSSDKAAKWLRWKMHHPQYKDDPIDSAEEFVQRVANGSVQSGMPYKLILPNGEYVNAGFALEHELQTLEKDLLQYASSGFSPSA